MSGPGVTVNRVGAMLTAFFHPGPVRSFADAAASDTARFARFHAHMLARGVYIAPSQFEALMPSLAHTPGQVEQTAAAAAEFAGVSVLARGGRPGRRRQPALGAGASSRRARHGPARFAGRCPDRYLLGVEMIYEGYLLHYGRSRLFSQADAGLALLTGDYLYAAGLREICATGDLRAVERAGDADLGLRPQPGRRPRRRRRRPVGRDGRRTLRLTGVRTPNAGQLHFQLRVRSGSAAGSDPERRPVAAAGGSRPGTVPNAGDRPPTGTVPG